MFLIEKRKYIRLSASIGVSYRVIKDVKNHERQDKALSLVKNIGGGGIRLQVKEDLRNGDLLEIQIGIPHLPEPICAIGEVVWFSHLKTRDRETREAGVRFRDIDPKDLHRILEFVHTVGIG